MSTENKKMDELLQGNIDLGGFDEMNTDPFADILGASDPFSETAVSSDEFREIKDSKNPFDTTETKQEEKVGYKYGQLRCKGTETGSRTSKR